MTPPSIQATIATLNREYDHLTPEQRYEAMQHLAMVQPALKRYRLKQDFLSLATPYLFVLNAYFALLKREPTSSELEQGIRQVAVGTAEKIRLLLALQQTPEYRRQPVNIAGLRWVAFWLKLRGLR